MAAGVGGLTTKHLWVGTTSLFDGRRNTVTQMIWLSRVMVMVIMAMNMAMVMVINMVMMETIYSGTGSQRKHPLSLLDTT